MHALSQWKTYSIYLALAFPVAAAGPALVVDRGLPQANLNNSTGYRSNIRWSSYESGFLGDDFTVGAAGESWVIDAIRVWTVPGVHGQDPQQLGDSYQDVRLYFGDTKGGISPVMSGLLKAGSSEPSNANIKISDATSAGGHYYEDFGTNMRVWQIDFTQLNLAVEGGAKYRFGAFGLGRPDGRAGAKAKTNAWFNVATNAELAGAKQDGADGEMLVFGSGGKFEKAFDGKGAGWDKSSDINVQVFGHRVDAQ
jgi:hypothetical protein